MKEGVNVIGGWDANFETQTDYATILDAQENGRVLEQPSDFTTLTVWSNFTIQNGKLTAIRDTPKSGLGSGVALGKKGQVKHCLIQNNTFDYSGNCMGGGVGNDAVDANTDVCVDDCWIRNNRGTHGGGVRIRGTIQNSVIEDNTSTQNGGGVHLFGGACMYNCIIRNNTANSATAGVRMSGSPAGVLANCLIVGNHTTDRCGGLGLETSAHTVHGNTIVANTQASSTNPNWCGVRVNVGGTLSFCNNVVWGNKANGEKQNSQILLLPSYANQANNFANNAVVWSGYLNDDGSTRFNNEKNPTGLNTIFLDKDTDPGFVDAANAANADYSLLWTSSLINAGNDSKVQGSTDLAGNARKAGDHVDIGAYELPYYTLTIAAFDHATLTVGGETKTADDYSLPKGYTTTATIEPDENYSITSVTCGDAILTPEAGIYYTLPALLTDMTLTIKVQSTPTGIDDANTAVKAVKVIRNGQLLILRDGKEFNVLGAQL